MPSQPSAQAWLKMIAPVACVVLVEGDALVGMTEKLRQDALALFDRRAPQVLAIEFEEVVLDLVNPAARCWRLLGRTGGQGWMKAAGWGNEFSRNIVA